MIGNIMQKIKRYAVLFILIFLSSCIPSLEETAKVEGGAGQGTGSSSVITIADLLAIPPKDVEDRLTKDLPLPGGTVQPFGPVGYTLKFIEIKLNKVVQDIFTEMNKGGQMKNIILIFFTLYIALYLGSLFLGLIKASSYDIVVTIIKINFILWLATDYSNFSSVVKDVAEGAGNELIKIVSGAFSNGTSDFGFADDVVSTVLSFNMLKLLYALFSPETGAGWLYGVLMVMFIWFFVSALFKAVYILIVSMIVRAVLFGLAPLFLSFAIFKRTKKLFDGWVKQIANFTLMPVILFAFLGFYYSLIQYFLIEFGNTPVGQTPAPVSYSTAFKMPGNMSELFMLIFGVPGKKISGIDGQIPVDLAPLLILVVLGYVMRQMVDWAISLSSTITAAFSSFNAPTGSTQVLQQLREVGKSSIDSITKDAVKRIGTTRE